MNETIQNILNRRSIRAYKSNQVAEEDLSLILECGCHAATGMGKEPWHFTVLQNRKLMDEITEANRTLFLHGSNDFLKQAAYQPSFDSWRGAPTAIIVSSDGSDYAALDCANATQNMAVAAQSLGLGSCYLAAFKPALLDSQYQDLLNKLEIPKGYIPTIALVVGYPAETPNPRRPRKKNCINYVR